MVDKQAIFFNVIGGLVTVFAAFIIGGIILLSLRFFGVV